jgi:hypothetical protein
MCGMKSFFTTSSIIAALLGFVLSTDVGAQDLLGSAGPQFAPGVVTTIAPDVVREETESQHKILKVLADPKLNRAPFALTQGQTLQQMAQSAAIRRDVWCLELSFKPLRMIQVDIPQESGKMQRKLVWYLVYRVRNTGAGLAPKEQADGTFVTQQRTPTELQFAPQFLLTSQDLDREGKPVRKAYLSRIIPAAIPEIQRRELPQGKLLSNAEIAEVVLAPETGRAVKGAWGVATWIDVDPEIDFFSVFVGGLTNAYQFHEQPDKYKASDPPGKGRLLYKKLQLNFWRPGDEYAENEREIRYGPAPGKADLYGTGEGVAYRWIYR